jgi:hypothetical protein
MKKNYFVSLTILVSSILMAGNPNNPKGFVSPKDVFGTRNFIENKGQYDKALSGNYTIEAVLDNGAEKIYFTNKGLVYELIKKFPLTEGQREAMEKGKHPNIKAPKIYYVNMNWLNANSNITIEKSEKQSHYFTHGEAKYNSYAYKKLTYKNVYSNIDIEYTIPENKDHEIKYNVIMRPGANINDIKIAYSGDVDKIKRTAEGNILIKTPLDDIIEHAPTTFYENKEIVESMFTLKDNVISFNLPKGYNQNKIVVIDPFVSSVTTLSSNNLAFDVDYDYSGNVYVYGGQGTYKIAKYNSIGILQWTFSGLIVTPAWSSTPIADYASNFGINKVNGKTYTGQGYNYGGTQIIRLDALGNYDNFITMQNYIFEEVWDMGFQCATNELFILGGGTTSNISAATINPTTAAVSLTSFQPSNFNAGQDVASNAIDDAGNIFVIYGSGDPALYNNICAVNSTFNGNIWTQPSNFISFNEITNKTSYQGYTGLGSNGFNCLAVNNNYLFYYDGSNLGAYNKLTGALTASTTVPALVLMQQGGIAVDDCNNLYIGGNGSILSYNFNGTTFTALSSISIGASGLNQYVYDIKLDRYSNLLYVSGSGFVGTYSAANSNSCPLSPSACYAANQSYVICSGTSKTLTTLNYAALSSPVYSLNPGGQTNTTGIFIVSPNATTTYTSYVIGTNNLSVSQTISTVYTITVIPSPNTSITALSNPICFLNPVSLTASGANSYSWSINANVPTISDFPSVTTTYSVVGTNTNGCSNVALITITVNPLPNVSVISSSNPMCQGDVINITANGAITYTWNIGATGSIITVSPAIIAVYKVTGTDANGCYNNASITQSVSVCTNIGSEILIPILDVTVYPNPNKGEFIISSLHEASFLILNTLGQVIKSVSLNSGNNFSESINNVANGVYFLVDKNNMAQSVKQKIIVMQ